MVRQIRQSLSVPEVEEEDVLRTKIVSVQDFLKEKELWKPAVNAEMEQLFVEKKALRKTTMSTTSSSRTERQRAYAAVQSRLRRADRERREAEDQLMELEMSEICLHGGEEEEGSEGWCQQHLETDHEHRQ